MAAKKSPPAAARRLDPDDVPARFAAAARRYPGRTGRPPAVLPEPVRAVVLDRLEALYATGAIALAFDQFAALLRLVLPEEFADPPGSPSGFAHGPASAQAAGSPGRVADYRARAAAGEPVVRAGDLDAVRADRLGVTIRLRDNGHGFRTVGWAGGPGPGPLPAGMYKDARGRWFALD